MTVTSPGRSRPQAPVALAGLLLAPWQCPPGLRGPLAGPVPPADRVSTASVTVSDM